MRQEQKFLGATMSFLPSLVSTSNLFNEKHDVKFLWVINFEEKKRRAAAREVLLRSERQSGRAEGVGMVSATGISGVNYTASCFHYTMVTMTGHDGMFETTKGTSV